MLARLRPLCLVTLLVLLVACGEDPAVEPADVEEESADPSGTVVAVATTDLGEVLVDGGGMTLYLFEPDDQGAPTCYDDCANAWPPLLTDGEPAAVDGADGNLIGTAERDDGTTQVTYDGWPLYHWAGDSAPGETNGQGVNDVWWVLAPDGAPVRDVAGADDDGGSFDY